MHVKALVVPFISPTKKMKEVKCVEVFRLPDGRKATPGIVYAVSERYADRLIACGAAKAKAKKAKAKKKAKKTAKKA